MDWIQLIELLFTGGTLVGVCTIPASIKKAQAEAKTAEAEAKTAEAKAKAEEIANMKSVANGWQELAEERQEANKEKDVRIAELTAQVDARYVDIGEWRDKYNAKCEEITGLKVQIASNRIKICEKPGCADRTPPTGY